MPAQFRGHPLPPSFRGALPPNRACSQYLLSRRPFLPGCRRRRPLPCPRYVQAVCRRSSQRCPHRSPLRSFHRHIPHRARAQSRPNPRLRAGRRPQTRPGHRRAQKAAPRAFGCDGSCSSRTAPPRQRAVTRQNVRCVLVKLAPKIGYFFRQPLLRPCPGRLHLRLGHGWGIRNRLLPMPAVWLIEPLHVAIACMSPCAAPQIKKIGTISGLLSGAGNARTHRSSRKKIGGGPSARTTPRVRSVSSRRPRHRPPRVKIVRGSRRTCETYNKTNQTVDKPQSLKGIAMAGETPSGKPMRP